MSWTMEIDRRKAAKHTEPIHYHNDPYIRYKEAGVYRLALVEQVLEGIPFKYFFTGTWELEISTLKRATDLASSYFDKYKTKCNLQNDGFWYFVTSEKGGAKGRIHIHAMIGTTEKKVHTARRVGFHSLWGDWKRYRGRCSIDKIRSPTGVKGYCSKYIMKYGNPDVCDFNLSDWIRRDDFGANSLSLGFAVGRG